MPVRTLVLLSFLILSHSFSANAQGQKKDKKIGVFVSEVVEKQIGTSIEALGTTKANESVMITADTAEKVAEVHFEDGAFIEKGAPILTLNMSEEKAELSSYEAISIEAKKSYNRASGLVRTRALSQATLQERESALRQAESDVIGIKARIAKRKITAPFSGVLGLREVSIGALVQPGDMITTLDDLSVIKVDFEVPSIYLSDLAKDQTVTGKIEALNNHTFKGTIQTINTQIDPVTRTVKLRAILPNPSGEIKPGLLMKIAIMKKAHGVLIIPEEALIKKGQDNFVFRISASDDGNMVAERAKIAIGERQAGAIEVREGLKIGDKVVTHGVTKIRDGSLVTIEAMDNDNAPLDSLLNQRKGN